MVLSEESSLLFIMTEEISGAYKLVIYLSLPACCLVVCQLSVLQLIKTSREADQEERRHVVNLYIYIMKSQDKLLKIPLRFYYILKKTTHFTLHLELSIWRAVRFHFVGFFFSFLSLWDLFACGF